MATEQVTAPVETPELPDQGDLHPDQPVSIEIGDRVLTGVGETAESLREGITEPKPEKPSRGQKRFGDLTREREEANRKAEAAESRAQELEARLKALEARPAAPTAQPDPRPVVTPPPASQPTRVKPSEDEVGSKYATYGEYVEDLADWKTEQRLAALNVDAVVRRSIEADTASRTAADRESKSIDRGRAAYADFDAVMKAPHFYDGQWPQYVRDAIAGLDEPEHVYHKLGSDPALAYRIRSLPPVKLGMELARLVTGSAVASSASTAAPVVSLPPPPMQPVGSGSKTTVLSPSDLAERGDDDYDRSGFREAMRAQKRR